MTPGLLLTSFVLGLRHGVDWDHLAAIADLTGSAGDRRRGFALSSLYAAGHALVVLVLGIAAIEFGALLPDGADEWMGRFAGVTLLLLGGWVLVELARKGRDFRLRSRWILVLRGSFAGLRQVRERGGRRIAVEHEHPHRHHRESTGGHEHRHLEDAGPAPARELEALAVVSAGRTTTPSEEGVPVGTEHTHAHRHELLLPDRVGAGYGAGTAAGIGMLHGVGVESPTQIAVFVASTAVAGRVGAMGLLLAWVAGLVVANSAIAIAAALGFLGAERHFRVYAVVAVAVAAGSLAMGAALLAGVDVVSPIG